MKHSYSCAFLLCSLLASAYSFSTSTSAISSMSCVGRAVLWDVDGTLSDSYLLGFSSTQSVLSSTQKAPITEAEYHLGTKYTTPRRLSWHVTGDPDHEVGEELGRQFDSLYVQLVSPITAALYPGTADLLLTLSQYPGLQQGALSNACGAYVRAVLTVNKIDDMFGVQLGADEVAEAKPRPQGLLRCCEVLNVKPQSCVYIGDSPTDGMAAAAAGMRSIGVTWGSHPIHTITPAFTHTAHSMPELQGYIEQILAEPLD
mmetsp:Transcript_7278/g.15927  ORF Transcript_7278/g.15927 Transcript_7278/m.15927 type:complete len:258 (+) Transcript_7278:144-917(+)